jgi:hypothetical protein
MIGFVKKMRQHFEALLVDNKNKAVFANLLSALEGMVVA